MVLMAVLFSFLAMPAVNAGEGKKWFFGLGTGFTFMNAEGDQGLNVGSFGPVIAEIDLDPSDFQDMMESAFGLGGYATDGTWMIQYSFGKMNLGGEPAGSLPAGVGGGTYAADWFFDITFGQATVGYTSYRSKDMKFSFTPYTGFRYIKHELGADISVTQGATTTAISRAVDYSWTDVLIGGSMSYMLSPKWSWNLNADAGFGGTEGTYSFATNLSWKAHSHWSISPNFSYSALEMLNGEIGDSDFYIYDANEFGMGISVLYHF
jgi:hypothetical protein